MFFLLVFMILTLTTFQTCAFDYFPEGIHISKGSSASEMRISWATMKNPFESRIEFGIEPSKLDQTLNGTRYELITAGRVEYLHYITIAGLQHKTRYFYRVGSDKSWSDIFDFVTYPVDTDTNWSPRIAVYGDLGVVNGKSLSYLKDESKKDEYDMFIHLGDIGYDLFSFQGRVGDMFMRAIEPIAARVPYMVVPGNHEYMPAIGDGGKNYISRFMMVGDNNYHTFTLGAARFIAINTEVYFMSEGGNPARAHLQLKWLDQVLSEANKPDQRSLYPWIIILQHRPVYCSNAQFGRCPGGSSWIRDGIKFLGYPGLENMFMKHQVDLVLCGHNHHYERTLPVYDNRVILNTLYNNLSSSFESTTNSLPTQKNPTWKKTSILKNVNLNGGFSYTDSNLDPYHNARAPVYVVTGAPGNQEIKEIGEEFSQVTYPWVAFQSREIGYSRLKVTNSTHLTFEQVAVNRNLKVIDTFTLTKDKNINQDFKR